eukprot:605663-Prorocentrum_minimum.AAC.1
MASKPSSIQPPSAQNTPIRRESPSKHFRVARSKGDVAVDGPLSWSWRCRRLVEKLESGWILDGFDAMCPPGDATASSEHLNPPMATSAWKESRRGAVCTANVIVPK